VSAAAQPQLGGAAAAPADWLAQTREASAWVAQRARSVQILESGLRAYADALPLEAIAAPEPDAALASLAPEPELRAAFAVALDAVNFGSGYFPLLRKRPGHSGYRTVEAALRERFAAAGPLRAAELAASTPEGCAELFGQTLEGPVGELMTRFAQAWRELGAHLLAAHGGSFFALARGARPAAPRAAALVGELAALPSYRDVARYEGREIPFLKRAQITAADLALALPELSYPDLAQLTLFADNLVPHVLRLDGVLAYAPELLERIEREQPLDAGSPEEVEIRACALHAVELLCARAARRGPQIAPYQLDRWLWLRGGGARYKAAPRHRARSWYY
jgi:hypothetical protein